MWEMRGYTLPIRRIGLTLTLAVLVCLWAEDAHAYFDPGTGSMILQAILAALIGKYLAEDQMWFQIKVVPNTESPVKRILWEQFKLPRLLKVDHIDALFVPWPSLPWRCPCPTVIAIRNMEPYCSHVWPLVERRQRLRYRYLRWSTNFAIRHANRVILVAEATKSLVSAEHRLDERQTTVIHHGRSRSFRPIPKDEAWAFVREKFGLQRPFILYVSKTRPYKNHIELLEAFSILQQVGHALCLVIAGELQQPYYEQISNRVNVLGLSEHVHFLGNVKYDLLPYLYNACEVFAFPSTCEACPNIMIEALACGVAIAASDIPVMKEIGADGVMYFDAFDPKSIADTLDTLLANPTLSSEFRTKALQRAGDFSWRYTAERTLQVIKDAAQEGRPGPGFPRRPRTAR